MLMNLRLKQSDVYMKIADDNYFTIDPYISYSAFKNAWSTFKKLFFNPKTEFDAVKKLVDPTIFAAAVIRIPKDNIIVMDKFWGVYVLTMQQARDFFRMSGVNLSKTEWRVVTYDSCNKLNQSLYERGPWAARFLDSSAGLVSAQSTFTYPFHKVINTRDNPCSWVFAICSSTSGAPVGLISGGVAIDTLDARLTVDKSWQILKQHYSSPALTLDWLNTISSHSSVSNSDNSSEKTEPSKYRVEACFEDVAYSMEYHEHGNIEDFSIEDIASDEIKGELPSHFSLVSVSADSEAEFTPDEDFKGSYNPLTDEMHLPYQSDTGDIRYYDTVTVEYKFETTIPANSALEAAKKAFKYINDCDMPADDWESDVTDNFEAGMVVLVTGIDGTEAEFTYEDLIG